MFPQYYSWNICVRENDTDRDASAAVVTAIAAIQTTLQQAIPMYAMSSGLLIGYLQNGSHKQAAATGTIAFGLGIAAVALFVF